MVRNAELKGLNRIKSIYTVKEPVFTDCAMNSRDGVCMIVYFPTQLRNFRICHGQSSTFETLNTSKRFRVCWLVATLCLQRFCRPLAWLHRTRRTKILSKHLDELPNNQDSISPCTGRVPLQHLIKPWAAVAFGLCAPPPHSGLCEGVTRT